MITPLAYLDFDVSDDPEGRCSFDAMAAVFPEQLPALQAELVRVLDWAEREFGSAGPVDEGSDWDFELQGVREVATTLAVRYTPGAAQLDLQASDTGAPRTTLSLTLTGTPAFCAAFRHALGS
jgi:hypothetical protein